MIKQYYLVPIGYFTLGTLLLTTTITCDFPRTSQSITCVELNKVNKDSLSENTNNYSPTSSSLSFNSTMVAGTAQTSPSPSPSEGYLEPGIS